MPITGPGTLLDASTGQVLGKVDRITIAISCDTRPLRDAFEAVTLQLRTTAEQMRQFGRAFGDRRLETLRHQARRKGRPGWRAIRIPKAPRFLITHDDHVDALGMITTPAMARRIALRDLPRVCGLTDRSVDPFAPTDDSVNPPLPR